MLTLSKSLCFETLLLTSTITLLLCTGDTIRANLVIQHSQLWKMEFHAIQEACQVFTSHYTYHVCIKNSAWQTSGTGCYKHIGYWAGATVDVPTGGHVWRWTGGQEGSTGTAWVTCDRGEESTRITSAWENPVNQYKFKMASPLACTDNLVGQWLLENRHL